ncbi:hypothetical protein [Natrinema longum]|uniref:Uncharacterized protein n=1 Tax=Natrinema longum TaxID=370324 RepID=A0A8A2UA36_9EURY|nr:hypothetical protein [Natrinema longum]MBZ6496604.1 hypothetical protein [Natrinema longum]QSW85497.1 hypothetical protein J0X27_01230 [Natrinema longum]
MTRQNSGFDPTHVLVVTGDQAAEIRATNAAIDAILDHADTVDIWIEEAQLGDDHPALVASLRDAFARVSDDRFRGTVDDVRSSLSALLSDHSFHRFVSLRRLDAFRDGQRLLTYVPDHRTFEVKTTVSSGVEAAIRGSVETEAATLLPAGPLVDWDADGHHYELSPPHLCLEEGCHALTNIAGVALDDDRREIRLEWETGSETVRSRLVGKLSPEKPTRFRFDSTDRYEDVASAFDELADDLEW